jgi:O-antigen/teichoic acid export membrane protein
VSSETPHVGDTEPSDNRSAIGRLTSALTSRQSLRADLITTTAATALVLVANLVLGWLLSHRGGVEVFGAYNLGKRVASAGVPLVTLGLTLSLARLIPTARSEEEKRGMALSALALCVGTLLVTATAVSLAPRALARVLVGTPDALLLWATVLLMAGQMFSAVVFAVYRGRMLQAAASTANIVSAAVLPVILVATLVPQVDVRVVMLATGALVWILNIALLASQAWGARLAGAWDTVHALMAFGAPRIPAGLALGMSAAVPPLIATHADAPRIASFLLAGISLSQMGAASLQALSVTLLPRVSEMHGGGRHSEITRLSARILTVVLVLAAAMVPPLVAAAPSVVRIWLGPEFAPGVGVMRIVMLAIPGVLVYGVISSIADASVRRPVNTYATIGGLVVTGLVGGLFLLSAPSWTTAVGYALGQTAMAIVTAGAVMRRWGAVPALRPVAGATLIAIVLGVGVVLLQNKGVSAWLVCAVTAVSIGVAALPVAPYVSGRGRVLG